MSDAGRLCFTLQRYKIESNSQHGQVEYDQFNSCVSHCKDTKLKAIHNGIPTTMVRALLCFTLQRYKIESNSQLKSGSINIRRGSINDTLSHTANLDIHNALFDIENKVTQFKWHGWAPTKPNKHKDTAYFNYYEIVINGRTYYANVKVLKKDGKEVLYCIRDNIGIANTGQTPI